METIVAAAISAFAVIVAAWINAHGRARPAPPPTEEAAPVPRERRLRRWWDGLWALLGRLPPPTSRTKPWLAAALAFLLSGIGIALYFRKPFDVFVGILFVLPLGAVSSTPPGEPVTIPWWYWIFAGVAALYALLRAESANRRLEAEEAAVEPALAP